MLEPAPVSGMSLEELLETDALPSSASPLPVLPPLELPSESGRDIGPRPLCELEPELLPEPEPLPESEEEELSSELELEEDSSELEEDVSSLLEEELSSELELEEESSELEELSSPPLPGTVTVKVAVS